jgi:hypothetical protein
MEDPLDPDPEPAAPAVAPLFVAEGRDSDRARGATTLPLAAVPDGLVEVPEGL